MRSAAVLTGSRGANTNTVSGRLNSPRDRLHPRVVEAVGVEHDGERVAGERRLGEHVEKAIGAAHV